MKGKMPRRVLYRFAVVWMLLAGFWVFSSCVHDQPRTLYRARDIENARANVKRYDWAKAIVRGWEKSVKFAMKKERQFFMDFIPELTPGSFYGQNCPACVGDKSLMGEAAGLFSWSITSPDVVRCKRCGTVFPNDAYPETGGLECPLMGQTFTYYQSPEERALGPDATGKQRAGYALKWLGDRPTMTSFSGMVRMGKIRWAWGQCLILAKLYSVTGEVAYAERVAWILDRFAQVFPKYLYHSYDGSYADWLPARVAASMGDEATSRGGRFPPDAIRHAYGLNRGRDAMGKYSTLFRGFWGAGRVSPHGKGSDAGPLLDMVVAYDLTRDACYAGGTPVYDAKMRKRIRDDLLIAGCNDMEHWNSLSNKGVASYSLSAAVGLLFEDPARVHRAVDGFVNMLDRRYHFDGFYAESPAYALHNYSNMRELTDMLFGYSDPAGYKPEEGNRLDNFNPFGHGRFHLALLSTMRQLAPGNRLPVIGDTAYDRTLSPLFAEVLAARLGGPYVGLAESLRGKPLSEWGTEYSLWYRPPDQPSKGKIDNLQRTEWFPGWHVGVLRGGRETNDTALFFNGNEHRWTQHTGHRHRDILSISFYAFGRELASDRGYFSGGGQRLPDGRSGQSWVASSLSHNLVLVDEKSQERKKAGSHLELFGTASGIKMVQASAVGAYPQCREYRRTCAMIETPGGQDYLVDLFRVKGGKTHQYAFHSNGTLAGFSPAHASPEPAKLAAAWNLWLENPGSLVPLQPYTFTWKFDEINLDLMLLNTGDTVDRVIIADAPGWRKGSPKSELDKPAIQQILAEKSAAAPLTTQYAAVIVPYPAEASPVLTARLLENDCRTGAMAVEVRFADRTDYIISTKDQEMRSYGPVKAAGRFAVVSVDAEGRLIQAYLLAGVSLECGETRISLPSPGTTRRITSVSGRTFHLAEPLSPDLAPRGAYVLVSGPTPMQKGLPRPQTGFEIESATADSVTVRDYPVFECDEITVLHSVWRGIGSRESEDGKGKKLRSLED
jgi:hypothetical protein